MKNTILLFNLCDCINSQDNSLYIMPNAQNPETQISQKFAIARARPRKGSQDSPVSRQLRVECDE